MSAAHRFSVVIPARDALPDVIDAVQSALAQSLPPFEVIVVDDGSSDGTAEALARSFGHRVRVLAGRRGSAAAARNAGWREAGGEWIAFLDADDVWFPEKLATAAATLERAPGADWFFSDGAFRTFDGQVHASWFALYADLVEPYLGQPVEQLFEVNFILTSSLVARRSVLESIGGFDERLTHAEDLDLWIKLARRGPGTASRRSLVRYQHREGGLSQQVERRLAGGATLFERLERDAGLTPELRRAAARRRAMYQTKLAAMYLREGQPAKARAALPRSGWFPDRAAAVLMLFGASCLPPALFARLRRRPRAQRVAAPMLELRRVRLASTPPIPPPAVSRDAGSRP